jgi:hypothetical protein
MHLDWLHVATFAGTAFSIAKGADQEAATKSRADLIRSTLLALKEALKYVCSAKVAGTVPRLDCGAFSFVRRRG